MDDPRHLPLDAGAARRHGRHALAFLLASMALTVASALLLEALGMVQWPAYLLGWLVNLGAAFHLARMARAQGRRLGWLAGVVAAGWAASSIGVYAMLKVLGPARPR